MLDKSVNEKEHYVGLPINNLEAHPFITKTCNASHDGGG